MIFVIDFVPRDSFVPLLDSFHDNKKDFNPTIGVLSINCGKASFTRPKADLKLFHGYNINELQCSDSCKG